jgi:hypothetical protein
MVVKQVSGMLVYMLTPNSKHGLKKLEAPQ